MSGDPMPPGGAEGPSTVPAAPVVPDFDGWVAAHGSALLRFAYAVVGEPEAAERTLRMSLARAYPRWPRLISVGDPAHSVRRMILSAHASRWRRTGWRERPGATGMIDLTSAGLRRANVSLSDLVWEWYQDLPTRQRAAVALRFYDRLSYAQIASSLGCGENAARSHVHRGLVALRLAIEDAEDLDD
jgi:DNA-directed RNA polymerase specialized sigma24 family protein